MLKYPSIEQFRNIIKTVRSNHDYKGKDNDGNTIYNHDSPYPILTFKGTVKLHGTNAAVVKYKDNDTFVFQSRERELSLTSDNAGFMLNMSGKNLSFLFDGIEFENHIVVYGEWCGGSIQKGVALNQLPKMFVIFGVKVDDKWIDIVKHDNEQGIYHIEQFPVFMVNIDFNNPELIQNTLLELTMKVEELCPVGKQLGVEGIGEGIVFTSIDNPDLKFKSKGEKHSVSKVKVLNSINEEELNSINEFVEYSVTENRLKQGLDYMKENNIELSQKNTGEYIRWVINDIIKEESDVIVANTIDLKKANAKISQKTREFYFNNISF